MGANAQTAVPTFTASQVLTAAQMNQSARTGVPVFASTVTRDAAFGGTGEKTLAEGQMCYVEGTGLQTYNGTAWVTWGAAPSSGALTYITGATFSAAATVSSPTSTFTSTYANYKIIVDITSASTDIAIAMRLRVGGADNTTSNYNNGFTGIDNLVGTQTKTISAGTAFAITDISSAGVGREMIRLDVFNPQLTIKTEIFGQAGRQLTSTGGFAVISGGGIFNATTSFDAFSIVCSTGNITGNYRVYAYANS